MHSYSSDTTVSSNYTARKFLSDFEKAYKIPRYFNGNKPELKTIFTEEKIIKK